MNRFSNWGYYLFYLLIVCFFSITSVEADVCSQNDISRLRSLANQVNIENVYVEDSYLSDEGNRYTISVENLGKELYLLVNDEYEYFLESNQEYVQFEQSAGEVIIEIYGFDCTNLLRTVKLSLPFYNTYSDSEECKKLANKNLEICDKWYQGTISTDIFRETVEPYLETNDKSISIIDFGRKYLGIIVGGVITLIIIIIILVNRYKRRNVLE